MAYHIPETQEHSVRKHLDFREKDGYEKVSVKFHPEDSSYDPFYLDIYIGTEDNPFFLGPADLKDIALQIYSSEGPSGKNTEYLFELAQATRALMPNVEDSHLFGLEKEVRKLCQIHGHK